LLPKVNLPAREVPVPAQAPALQANGSSKAQHGTEAFGVIGRVEVPLEVQAASLVSNQALRNSLRGKAREGRLLSQAEKLADSKLPPAQPQPLPLVERVARLEAEVTAMKDRLAALEARMPGQDTQAASIPEACPCAS
jgi:hypothetical protein